MISIQSECPSKDGLHIIASEVYHLYTWECHLQYLLLLDLKSVNLSELDMISYNV